MGGVIKRASDTPVEAGSVLQTDTRPKAIVSDEGSAWFWRIFGGTILGAITFLLVTMLNHLNSNIDTIRSQQVLWQKEIQSEVSGLRDRVVKMEEMVSTMKQANKEMDLGSIKDRITAVEQARELDKERKVMIDEQIKSIQADLKELHKITPEESPTRP